MIGSINTNGNEVMFSHQINRVDVETLVSLEAQAC